MCRLGGSLASIGGRTGGVGRYPESMAWTLYDRALDGFVYEVDGHTIWGATARILHEFLDLWREIA